VSCMSDVFPDDEFRLALVDEPEHVIPQSRALVFKSPAAGIGSTNPLTGAAADE